MPLLTRRRSFAYTVSTATILATTTMTTYTQESSPSSRRLKGRRALDAVSGAPPHRDSKRAAESTTTTTVDAGLTITSFINAGSTKFDQTVTSTTTTTLALPAPTYSHVYAASPGCQNTPTVDTLQLDPSVTDKHGAISMCQDSCTQNGKCASLFVQYLFPTYGDTTPVYKCFMNGQRFDESSNLICDLSEDIWGAADAYDAVGRGVAM